MRKGRRRTASQPAGKPSRIAANGSPAASPPARYVSRLAARASLYSDLQVLLADIPFPLPREEYRRRVVEENVLARATLAGRQKVWMELAPRYRLDANSPLFVAFLDEYRRCGSEGDRALVAYLLFALHDQLVADLGTHWLYQYLRSAPSELRPADVLAFLAVCEGSHPEVRGWSAASRKNIASHYLSLLKEFGLARGSQRKFTIRPACGPGPVRFLLRALLLNNASNLAAVQSPLFRLLGLTLEETVKLLFRFHADGDLRCRIQGDVVDLDLNWRRGA